MEGHLQGSLQRPLDAFRQFLEEAAQANGTIINYANIARDVGADPKMVVSYFSILEDTLVGFPTAAVPALDQEAAAQYLKYGS